MCFFKPVQHYHCATIPQGQAFTELGTSLQKTKIAPSQAACSLEVITLSIQNTKYSTETAHIKAGSLQQSKDMNLCLLLGQCIDHQTIILPLICFQLTWLGVSVGTSILDKALLIFNCKSIRNTYFPRVDFGSFFLDHWKLPLTF